MSVTHALPSELVTVQARLRALEDEASGLVRRLRELPEADLAGAHLVVESSGKEALLSAAAVSEVVRVVALQPVTGMAPAVAGAFTCRGRSLFALELGALLEGRPAVAPRLDAHLVVLGTAAPLALLVDRVKAVVSEVRLVADDRRAVPRPDPKAPERRARQLSQLLARVGPRVMPLLDPGQLSAFVEGHAT